MPAVAATAEEAAVTGWGYHWSPCKSQGVPAVAAGGLLVLIVGAVEALSGVFEVLALSILGLALVAAVATFRACRKGRVERPRFSPWVEDRTARRQLPPPTPRKAVTMVPRQALTASQAPASQAAVMASGMSGTRRAGMTKPI